MSQNLEDLCCILTRGNVKIAEYPDTCPTDEHTMPDGLIDLGHVQRLSMPQERKEISKPSSKDLGGTACYLSWIDKTRISLALNCVTIEALKIAFQGAKVTELSGSIVAEPHEVVSLCDLISLNRIPDTSIAISVSLQGGGPLTLGTDYKLNNGQIQILETGSLVIGNVIEVSYTYKDIVRVEGLLGESKEYVLVIDALNYGDNKHPLRFVARKVRFTPVDEFLLLTADEDGFVTLNLEGELIEDDCVSSDGVSKYYYIEWSK